jgi:hypothetical protein
MSLVAPAIAFHDAPLADSSQRTVGLGEAAAPAENVAVCPACTDSAVGCKVTSGAETTVSFTERLVADPAAFLNTTSKW